MGTFIVMAVLFILLPAVVNMLDEAYHKAARKRNYTLVETDNDKAGE